MASARCVYCDATLQPNTMYCGECGQLIPQAQAPVAAAVASPAASPHAVAAPPSGREDATSVPLPKTLPWQQPGSAAPASAPQPERIDEIEITFSGGAIHRVAGMTVIGRKPADTAHTLGARAIDVQDDTRSVSRVHLYITVENGRILVSDAGSANGSRLQRGAQIVPVAGDPERTAAMPGDVVWIGDISFQITAAR